MMMNSSESHSTESEGAKIIKEGYVYKRGEVIKNWRIRYFYLFSNGSFIGYKLKPESGPSKDSDNVFNLLNCRVIATEIPKNNGFILRCYMYNKIIDRRFRVETRKDRDDWVEKIKTVAGSLSIKDGPSEMFKQIESSKIGPYRLIKLLGEGTFGKVILAENEETKQFVAVKVLKKELIYENDEVTHIELEGQILKSFNHPFLISMVDFLQTRDRIFFVMEFLNGGDLFYHLVKDRGFSESRTKLYAAEIILALQFLHRVLITYRDLKLENTILDSDGHIKLCDFGLCKGNVAPQDSILTFCGTREYLAPEILLSNAKGYSIDWWCLGVFLYECITTHLPFNYHPDDEVLYSSILNKNQSFLGFDFSPEAKSLISQLLIKDPKKRLGCTGHDGEAIKSHIFFEGYNWDDVYNKQIEPEYVPSLTGPDDTSYFCEDITSKSIEFSPPSRNVDFDLKI